MCWCSAFHDVAFNTACHRNAASATSPVHIPGHAEQVPKWELLLLEQQPAQDLSTCCLRLWSVRDRCLDLCCPPKTEALPAQLLLWEAFLDDMVLQQRP